MPDDVDVSADETHLEAADAVQVDRLGAVQQPLLLCHLDPSRPRPLPWADLAIYRVCLNSRYIASPPRATPHPPVEFAGVSLSPHVENAGVFSRMGWAVRGGGADVVAVPRLF